MLDMAKVADTILFLLDPLEGPEANSPALLLLSFLADLVTTELGSCGESQDTRSVSTFQ